MLKRVCSLAVFALALAIAGLPTPGRCEPGETEAGETGERESPPERLTRETLMTIARLTTDRVTIGRSRLRIEDLSPSLSWTPLGPQPIAYDGWAAGQASGRVSAIAIDPRNANTVFIAAAQGGVWKSADGGASWTALTDNLSSLASGALALDPAHPDTVYYGTGEMHQSGDSYYGDGLFRSVNGGASWSKIASRSSVGSYISRVAVNPADPNILYATSDLGFVRSVDGGSNWSVTLSGDWCFDLVQDPLNVNEIFATMAGLGVYRSIDAGASWVKLAGGLPTTGIDRINLAIAPSDHTVLYASFVTPAGALFGMYRTADNGDNWSPLASTPNYCGTQGWYDNCVIVDPANPNICYAGGMYPYSSGNTGVIKTTNGGASWVDVTIGIDGSRVHPDQHIFAFGPDGSLWLGNDGGVRKTDDGAQTWIDRNSGLAITQFYTVAIDPSANAQVMGGTQDNGTVIWQGAPNWPQVIAGDGGYCLFRWDSPNFYYTTYVSLSPVYKWNSGSYAGTVTGPWAGSGDRASFLLGPLVQDYNVGNTLLAGTYRVYRTGDGGGTWSLISPDLTEGNTSDVLRSVAVAPGASNTIYAGSFLGRLYRTTDATTWTARETGLPRKSINDVAVSPADPLIAYISSDTSQGGRAFKTIDGGVNWTSLGGDLPPNLRGECLAADFSSTPPHLYLGTDYGVYASTDDGAHWSHESAGLPNCAVFDLAIDPRDRSLVAATHGRGMWVGRPSVLAVGAQSAPATRLLPITPNPSRAPVRLEYDARESGRYTLEVFDLLGRRVRLLDSGDRTPGRYTVTWDGRDGAGRPVRDGVFFSRLMAPRGIESRRLVLVR